MQVETKPIWESSTFWFGALQILLGLVGLISGHMDTTAAYALITTGVGTVGFRFKSDTPVSLTGGTKYR